MKKFTAILAALMLSCAMFTACGDSDKDNDAKDTKESAAASDSKGEEKNEVSFENGALTKAFSDKMASGTYYLDTTTTADLLGETPMTLSQKDGNVMVKMSIWGMSIEEYIVDGTAYIISADENAYATQEGVTIDDLGLDTTGYSIDDSYTYVETKEEDGYFVDVYTVSADIELGEGVTIEGEDSYDSTYSYYYDSNGDLKKIVSTGWAGDSTTVINSLKFGDDVEDITVPDLSGYTLEEGEGLF